MNEKNKIRRVIKNIIVRLSSRWARITGEDLTIKTRHRNYESYISKQKEKTLDPERIEKWKNEEWQVKMDGFRGVFARNADFLNGKRRAICLGARTGQEVVALKELGIDAIGVDLVEFPPHTVYGDIHNLEYKDSEFDVCFTNIMDHSLYPEKFCKEMERVCAPGGVIILNLQIGLSGDEYSENIIHNDEAINKMFGDSNLSMKRWINNSFDGMNCELVFTKR